LNAATNPPAGQAGPSAPNITSKDLLRQFWADAYGKEVQTAATYSYTWLADQFGHICLGIIIDFLATLLCGFVMVELGLRPKLHLNTGLVPGLLLTVCIVSYWEWSAYRSSVKQATGAFPLDTKLLRNNALVAAGYMALGAVLGFAFHLPAPWALSIAAAVVVVAILLAPPWLRQKIIWQKASIPYLFRLADAAPTVKDRDARILQSLIDGGAPPITSPYQVVVGGPIGSGRSSIAAGIGTEFAFKQNKVRYLGLDSLLEFATNVTGNSYPDDPGPTTISYWPWSEAQVVIIDGVGPLIAANEPGREANLERFNRLLQSDLKSVAGVLKRCHTVWVIGDLSPPPPSGKLGAVLDDFAKAVAAYCDSRNDAFVVELDSPPARTAASRRMLGSTRGVPLVTNIRGVRRVSRGS